MADDKTTKMPEQPVTDTGSGKETPPEPEKTPTPSEAEKKTEQQAKNPQVSVYDFAEIMRGKKVEERAAVSGGEKPAPAKTEKPEKHPEAPKKVEGKQEKPKEPEQPKRRGRSLKEDKDKAAAPKPKAPAQKKQEKAPKEKPEKKAAPTVQAAPAPKEPEGPKEVPRRGEEQIVYIKLNELHAFKNHPFEVRDDEEMRAMVSSVKDKGVTQPAIVRPREDGAPMISRMRSASIPPGPIRSFTFFPVMICLLDDNVLSAGRSSRLPVLIPGTVDLTEQGGDILPVFLHMELQQPDDKAGDAATTGGPDQHGDPAVQSPVNVCGLPLSGLGSGNQKPPLVFFRVCHFPCPHRPFIPRHPHRRFRGWGNGI